MKYYNIQLPNILAFFSGAPFAFIVGSGALTVSFGLNGTPHGLAIFFVCISFLLSCRINFSLGQLTYLFLILLFYSYLMGTSIYAVEPILYQDNLVLSVFQILLISSAVLILSPRSAGIFLNLIIFFSILVSFRIFYSIIELGSLSEFGTEYRLTYLTLSMMIALGLLASIGRFMVSSQKKWRSMLVIVILIVGLSLSLGRGPMILSVITIIIAIPIITIQRNGLSKGIKKLFLIYSIVAVVCAVILMIAMNVERSRIKLLRLLNPLQELDEGGRGAIWREAIVSINSSPVFGHGIGSSGVLSGNGANGYPHNILLEAWIEGGIPALFLLLLILITPFLIALLNWKKIKSEPNTWALLMGIFYLSLEYMKSETLYAIHILFIWSIVFITMVTKKRLKNI